MLIFQPEPELESKDPIMTGASGVITQIFIYPVKSCAALCVERTQVKATGLAYDRDWMIVDQDGLFLTQRQVPHLCWVSPTIDDHALTLDAPGVGSLRVPLDAEGDPRQVKVWRDTIEAIDMGREAQQWLDEYLQIPGKQFSLVRYSDRVVRTSDLAWTQGTPYPNHFSDGFAINVLSQRAMVELNERLAEQGHDPVDVLRFRPNLVLEGLDPHEEDHLEVMRIDTTAGEIDIALVKPCPRCPIPNIDPQTAISSPEVSNVLSRYRTVAKMDGAVCFGMNGVVKAGAGQTIHVGHPFTASYRW